ncbi:hypothetical protein BCR44DRAFT_1103587 [Catenaria anguillulae PL171]|uniref:SUN domain-containing protein n=1 Tax=Catenaria anguillulae PL171 TaxID=765915 RepID=A0A1Y2I286_9FUNG|nr:hypothetical protein BCR44DRAFT_1103587 [Catenaria anguillulae PL171]
MHPSAVIGGWLPASVIPWFLRPGVPAHGHNWALHPDMQRGSCWATPMGAGGRAPAKLTIRLARPVTPRAVAVWHHERGGLEAPRDVGVYGRRVRDGEWYLLARGEYVRQGGEGSAVGQRQVFEVQQGVHEEVDHVRFVVEKNWGAREYTCLYRVEVLAPAPAERRQW